MRAAGHGDGLARVDDILAHEEFLFQPREAMRICVCASCD
jgi:hypothetical protein